MRFLAAFLLVACTRFAYADAGIEAQVKAAYVLNFAKFTGWPAAALGAGGALQICVYGNAETSAAFTGIQGKSVQGRDVQVRLAPRPGDLSACHALYIDGSERAQSAAALKMVSGRPILTVSDIEGFADAGGMLQLVLVDGRIRFDANREAARSSGLQLRSQLLSLARMIK